MMAAIRALLAAGYEGLPIGLAACTPSLARDLQRLTPVSPAPAVTTVDSLVKLTLHNAIVVHCEREPPCPPRLLLASPDLSAGSIPSSETVAFVFATLSDLQALADRHDVIWYDYIHEIEVLSDSAEVLLGRTLVTGVNAPGMVDLGSSWCRWVFRRVESRWIVVRRAACLTT